MRATSTSTVLRDDRQQSTGDCSDVTYSQSLPQQPTSHCSKQTWEIRHKTLPEVKPGEHDAFEMQPDGNCLRAYSTVTSCEALKHTTVWAMRNTNNHNTAVLKKSCLGVLVCSSRHTTCPSDPSVHIKPAICHKARRKQIGEACPVPGCDGTLQLCACHGFDGHPVTHFWRTQGSTVYFQAKGVHDHPPPDPYIRLPPTTTRPKPKSRKRRNTAPPHTLTDATLNSAAKSVKVKKIKTEAQDEVTCSTDDVRARATKGPARHANTDDTSLIPDTTTAIGGLTDDCQDGGSAISRYAVTSIDGSWPPSTHGAALQHLFIVPAACNVTNQPYQQHQYTHHQATHSADDIDDILSVMASIAGVTPQHRFSC